MKSKTILSVLCLLLIVLVSLFAMKSPKAPSKQSTMRIGVLRVPNDMSAAREMGLIKQAAQSHGFHVKFYGFDSGVDANKALMANSIDLATMGDTNAVVAMASDIPVKLVWVNDVIGTNEQLVVKKSAHVKSYNDLKGKTIATPFASTSHYSLMMFLKSHHLLGKVHLMDMQTTEIVAAWRRGDIDGAYTWEPSLSSLPNRVCLVSSSQMEKEGYLTANVTLATNQFQNSHPKELRLLLEILGEIHDQYQMKPEYIAGETGDFLGISTSDAEAQIGSSRWLSSKKMKKFMGTTFASNFNATCQFMSNQQLLNSEPSKQDCKSFIVSRYVSSKEGGF